MARFKIIEKTRRVRRKLLGVHRTNFDKKILIDQHFAYRKANSHRFGATRSLLFY